MNKDRDTVSSIFLVLLAAWVCYLAKGLSLWSSEGPGDGFFPFLGGLVLGLLAICLFFQSLFKPKETDGGRAGTLKIKLSIYIGSLLAYALFFRWLGFPLASFFFLLAICKGAEGASWKYSIILSALSIVLCILLFYYLLDVPFPFGVLTALRSKFL